jgi:hypothetical protein
MLAQAPETPVSIVTPDNAEAESGDDAAPDIGVIGSGQQFGSKLEVKIAQGLQALMSEHRVDLRVECKGL